MTTTPTSHTDANRAYAYAYDCHYAKRELLDAIAQYRALITQYPNTPEATNSRAQIDNIAKSVIPADRLLDLKVELARTILLHAL